MGHVSASERVGSGSGNFLKRRLGEQARASYSAGAHLPTETSSHGGESRRFICSRPLGLPGIADVRVGLFPRAPRSARSA